ncbi:MAG TPA: DUF4097 family beta strand repeat-containing protein [Chloroflexota bacterium]|nr:DUF4097 family beta strand repeat-containing protein [Chloroflexota bacterium]
MSTSEERMRILEMVREGKITAEEGARLLEALQPKATADAGGGRLAGDDPMGSIGEVVQQAIQSVDWKGMLGSFGGSFGGSFSSGPLHGLERKREREQEGWEMLTLSDGDHGTFELREGDELAVEHEGGSIEAAAGEAPARLELEGDGIHDYGVYVARKDRRVVVACHRTAQFARMPRLKLGVPRGVADVSLRTAGGSLTAEEFAVPVHLKTSGGSIRVRGQRGAPVEAKTAGGSIKVDGTPSRIELHTSGGSINFEGRTEAFDVKTSGGSVRIDGACLTTGEHNAKTSGGKVSIGLTRDSSVAINAKTSAGSVAVDLPGAEGERGGSKISPRYTGRYNGGAATLNASTAAGSVSINLAEAAHQEAA